MPGAGTGTAGRDICRGGEPVQQVLRVERDDPLIALEAGRNRLHGPGPALGPGLHDRGAVAECQRDRDGTLGDQGHPPDRVQERPGRQLGAAAELGGEPRPVADELSPDQAHRQAASAALDADHALRRPAPGADGAKAIDTGVPRAIVLATSASVRAGTSAADRSPGLAGCQEISRTASRYRSVAASVSVSPSMSRHTAVSAGSVSSRLAAGVTWIAAAASTSPSTVPTAAGGSGSAG